MKLNNQEIRNCIFLGTFNDFLKQCNKNNYWVILQDIEPGKVYRFTKIELILRFFAFYDDLSKYTGKLARFLNDYMENNRDLSNSEIIEKETLFNSTVKILCEKLTDNRQVEKMPIAVFEAVMHGVAVNLPKLQEVSSSSMKKMYSRLKGDNSFSEITLKGGLSDKEKVIGRMRAAEKYFSEV